MNDPIVKIAQVNCDAATAFDVFVNRISNWWPLDGHAVSAASGKAALAVTIEPNVGGAIYETMFNGQRSDWGKVLEFEPGNKFAMTWHPGNNANNQTRVDVDFKDVGHGRCEVTLTHSGWEIWGDDAAARRDNYENGWVLVFETCYAQGCVPS